MSSKFKTYYFDNEFKIFSTFHQILSFDYGNKKAPLRKQVFLKGDKAFLFKNELFKYENAVFVYKKQVFVKKELIFFKKRVDLFVRKSSLFAL